MRSRRSANDEVADVARRRLEQLSAELAAVRPDRVDPSPPDTWGGPGEPARPEHAPRGPDPVPGRHAHRPLGLTALIAGWVLDRLPPTLQGRVRMSAAHLGVVALVVVGVLGVTAWWVIRAEGGSSAVQPVPVGAAPASPGGPTDPFTNPSATAGSPLVPSAAPSPGAAPGSAAQSPSPTSRIVVDVAGKVRRPGIATLPPGSRVVDALAAAGGARRGTRLGTLNLARVLTDGEQIVVGVPASAGMAASAASAPTAGGAGPPGRLVNINTASQAELEELPQVGPVTARSILDYRAENGTFTSVDQLLEVSGIGDATLAKIAPYVTL
jgi:competence protein ComEA